MGNGLDLLIMSKNFTFARELKLSANFRYQTRSKDRH